MKNVALITGVTGQDGSYLAEFLLEKGYEVHGIIRRSSVSNTERINHLIAQNAIVLHEGDLTDSSGLTAIIRKVMPDEVYNICSGKGIKLYEILDMIGTIAGIKVTGIPSSQLVRPDENKMIIGSNRKMYQELGWKPEIDLKQTLEEMILQ